MPLMEVQAVPLPLPFGDTFAHHHPRVGPVGRVDSRTERVASRSPRPAPAEGIVDMVQIRSSAPLRVMDAAAPPSPILCGAHFANEPPPFPVVDEPKASARTTEVAAPSPPPAPPKADTGGSGNSQSGGRGELQLVRALGEVILRAQEMQVERVLEQGRRLEETLSKQQCMLAALEKHIAVSPLMPPTQATLSHEMEPTPEVISKLESGGQGEGMTSAPLNTMRTVNVLDRFVVGAETPQTPRAGNDVESSRFESIISQVKCGFSKTPAQTDAPSRCGASFVISPYFGVLAAVMIFLNGIFILGATDNAARNPGEQTPMFYLIGETVFFFIFAVELALRIWVFRYNFFCGEDWRWNYFDTIIVFAAACEEVVKIVEIGGSIAKKATFLRIIRILRLGRILRIFRVVKLFRDLRIMLASIIATMMTLFWSIVCLVLIMITFATYFLTVVSDYQTSNVRNPELDQYFGSLDAMVLSLFQITTGGFDWRDASNLLMEVSPTSVLVLCVYISMMNYAILNILTGICCNTASKTAEEDFDITILEEQLQTESVSAKLAKYMHDNDVSSTGQITWKQLEHHFRNPEVRSWFKKLDLERWHLQSFFGILQASDDDEPSFNIDHFIRSCTRLRSNVKNIDLIAASHEQHNTSRKHYAELKQQVDAVQSFLMSHQIRHVPDCGETLV